MNLSDRFVCVGPQRTASSWLDKALRCHPQLSLPENVKETFFFDKHFDKGESWYLGLFTPTHHSALLGEVGSTYFDSFAALENISSHWPKARIIIMVRNPIARDFSSFCHEYAKARVISDFFQAIRQEPRIIESGRYSQLIPKWIDLFGSENVLFVAQDDLKNSPQQEVNRIYRFLGVDPVTLPDELLSRYNVRTTPKYRRLAGLASRSADLFRKVGLYWVVERAKIVGLKKVFEGGDPSLVDLTVPVFEFLLKEHEDDITFIESLLSRSFPEWRDKSTYGL